jgi:hypothetical protein
MATAAGNERRKSKGRQNRLREGNIETIPVGARGDGRHQEVIVHHERPQAAKKRSPFSWIEEFTVEWSERFISKN